MSTTEQTSDLDPPIDAGPPPDAGKPAGAAKPAGQDLPPPQRPLRRQLAAAGRLWESVEFWVLSRVAVVATVLLVGTIGRHPDQPWDKGAGWAAHRFVFYDSGQFLRTAEYGYFSATRRCCSQAFFPGYPLSIRALSPLVGGHAVWAALLITAVAGIVGAALLWRLATEHGGPDAGRIAVVALALNPLSVFMTVVYSEALFVALALGAWLLARRGRWWWAGLVAAGASGVRINGLFLLAGLAVMFLIQLRGRQFGVRWYQGFALGMPLLVVGAYVSWLHGQTGSWTAWQDAETLGWDRHTALPWTGVKDGYLSIVHAEGIHIVFSSSADLLAVILGLGVTIWLLVLRRLPEAVYMGLNLIALTCSTTLTSSDRYTLTWFPMYILLAEKLAPPGRRWLRSILVTAAVPMLAYTSVAWTMRIWIG